MEHGHDIEKLGRNIQELESELHKLVGMRMEGAEGGDDDGWKELFKIIHFPGWTTPAEYQLVSSIVESMMGQARAMTNLKQNLLQASRQIGSKEGGQA
ncbi:MAG TPA: hypothetical protein VNG90_04840 [Candidatus Acidoferrum sp.]|nr:hypothetical protein [Candidatus Acidoferrum sp.]